MKQFKWTLFVIVLFCLYSIETLAQQEPGGKEEFIPHHAVGLVIGHSYVFQENSENGNKEALIMPSWGVDYSYYFHPKWGFGLHTDIILEKFVVEKKLESGGATQTIERSNPVAPALMGIYKPSKHWGLQLGAGVEFAKEENLFLNRAGVEYSAELPKGWEVMGAFTYDIKWNAYDTWVLGLGISKSFGGHKK
jgi:hypothetical protein